MPEKRRKHKIQKIADGITMEKYQLKEGNKNFYIIEIEIQKLNTMNFTVDFTGSKNVELEGQSDLIKKTVINPFEKIKVAKLRLFKSWNLKTKFKFSLNLPEIEIQQKYIEPLRDDINELIGETQELIDMDFEMTPEKDLFAYLEENNLKFLDHDFLPINNSIGLEEIDINEKFQCLIHWRKSREFVLTEEEQKINKFTPFIINKEILPLDVKQGKLGNCWLLSSIASLAEKPKLIKRLILTKKPNKYGFYKLKVCKMGKWKNMVVDDYFPCFPLGDPIFSRNKSHEFWILLLEKAFAKLYGSYFNLENGDCRHSLIDLTGCPTFTYRFSDEKVKKMLDNDKLWDLMIGSQNKDYLMTAGTKDIQADESLTGLIKEHAYSIIKLEMVGDNRIMNLRNPWGVFEWTGDWSSASQMWTKEALEKIKPKFDKNDGNFWISFEDFKENFEIINICKVKCWNELRIKGKFIKSLDKNDEKISHFCSRWYYKINVQEKSKVIIGIHQEDERYIGVNKLRPYIDIGISILKQNGEVYKLFDFCDTEFKREIFLEMELEKGEYIIVPRSVGISLKYKFNEKNIYSYSLRNPLVLSFVKDLFEKYDIICNGYLDFKELKSFYKFLEKDLSLTEYSEIIQKYNIGDLKTKNTEGLSEKGFINLFESILMDNTRDKIIKYLKKLGYSKNLISRRSRVFMLTIHSDEMVKLSVKDSLQDNMDFIANKLLIRKYGKSIEKEGSSKKEVEAFFYNNKFFKKKNSFI